MPPDDGQRIRTLLATFGDRDSLGYFTTCPVMLLTGRSIRGTLPFPLVRASG